MTANQQQRQPTDASSHTGLFGNVILYRLLIAISVILVLLIIGILVIRKKVASTVTPAEFAAMEKLETTKISLPRDWHRPADVPPADVLDFHERFQTQMQRLHSKHEPLIHGDLFSTSNPTPNNGILESYWTSGTLTAAERTSFTLLVAELQPIIDKTSAAVNMQRYSLELDSHLLMAKLFEVQTFAKLLAILAGNQAAQGDCQQAFDTALLPLRLVCRPEQSSIITHVIGIALTNMVATSLYDVVGKCNDRAALQHAVTSLNDIYEMVFPGEIHDWFNDELVALRFAAAYGYPIDISPQPHADIIRQWFNLYALPYNEFLAGKFPPSDPRHHRAKLRISEYKSQLSVAKPLDRLTNLGFMSPAHRKLYTIITGTDPALLTYVRMAPNIEEPMTRAYVANAYIDLARLAMVQRLAEIEGAVAAEGRTASESLITGPDTATITAYLTPPPVDPFTSGTYPYSSALTRHYSAGPDLDDDKAAIKYDPTNGTASNGDVWLTGRW